MSLLALIVVFLIVGVVMANVNVDPQMKKIIIGVCFIAALIVILYAVGAVGDGTWLGRKVL